MAERLNALAYAHHMNGATNPESSNYDPNFDPRRVSFDVRTPQELAAVNEFLLTLGRDVAGGGAPPRRPHQPSAHNSSDNFPHHSYFDASSLSQLGLAGMPGLPGSGAGFTDPGMAPGPANSHHYPQHPYHSSQPIVRSNHPSVQPTQFTSMYPSVHDDLSYSPPDSYPTPLHSRRISEQHAYAAAMGDISTYPRNTAPQGHFYSSPPYEVNSPNSSVSTPSNATPPHMPISMPDTTSFGYLAEPRGAPPVANLAPVNYQSRSMRDIIPLKTAPGSSSPPLPVEPRLPRTIHRGPPAKLTPSNVSSLVSSSSKSGSLYPLLTKGDKEFKLPPITYRSTSPLASPPVDDSDSDHSSTSSQPTTTTLPSIRSFGPVRRLSESEELAKKVEKIELDNQKSEITPQQRERDVKLIWNILISVNYNYMDRFGKPDSKVKEEEKEPSKHLFSNEQPRDVEMTAA